MKILQIVGDSKWGGGGHIILALAEMAREAAWTIDILTTDPVCQRMFRSRGIGIVDQDVIWREIRPFRDLRGLFKLYEFLKANSYDLVHTHTSKAGFVGRIAARCAGTPAVVHTAHSFPFHEESGVLSSFMYRYLEACAARCCDRLVTVSEYHREWGLRWKIGHADKLVAIPNGIDDPMVASTDPASLRAELQLAASEIIFFTPGRLFGGKGLDYLIDALPLLASLIPDRPFRVVLAGEGPLRPALEARAAAMRVSKKLLFLGFRSDIPDLLKVADIVVLPSLHEGMSISLLEAMAAQKPIIATSIGGNLEPTGNGTGALTIPPKNSRALAEAMTTLVRNPQIAAEKSLNARRLFEAGYKKQIMVDRYRSLYQELLNTSVPELVSVSEESIR